MTALDQIKQQATPVPLLSSEEQDSLTEQIQALKSQYQGLLGFEQAEVKDVFETEMNQLQQRLDQQRWGARYPRISLDVLRWRDDEGLPVIAPFGLDSPWFRFSFAYRSDEWRHNRGSCDKFSSPIRDCYTDVRPRNRDNTWRRRRKCQSEELLEYVAKFRGILPERTRTIIREHYEDIAGYRDDHPLILCEVDQWVVNEVQAPKPDPLVVLHRAGALWLLDSFDETPVEEYIKEFCTNGGTP